jgi:hypothetical protein
MRQPAAEAKKLNAVALDPAENGNVPGEEQLFPERESGGFLQGKFENKRVSRVGLVDPAPYGRLAHQTW